MKPDACEAIPARPAEREPRPREREPRFPEICAMVLRTVSMRAPDPDVRLLPPRYARVRRGLAMTLAYPVKRLRTGVS
jgi:hypothetical protein